MPTKEGEGFNIVHSAGANDQPQQINPAYFNTGNTGLPQQTDPSLQNSSVGNYSLPNSSSNFYQQPQRQVYQTQEMIHIPQPPSEGMNTSGGSAEMHNKPAPANLLPSSGAGLHAFQMQFSQGSIPDAPLLSSGSFSGMKPINPLNLTSTDAFVAMHPTIVNGIGGNSIQHMPGGQVLMLQGPLTSVQGQVSAPQHVHPPGQDSQQVNIHHQMAQSQSYQLPPQYNPQITQAQSGMTSHRSGEFMNNFHQQIQSHIANSQQDGSMLNYAPNMFSAHAPSQQMLQNFPKFPGNLQAPNSNSPFASRHQLPKPWHSNDHGNARQGIVDEIIKLLKSRRPNAGDNWHEKLPHMAKKLEHALYHEANSLEEYTNTASLKPRLQQLAVLMGSNKSQSASNAGMPMNAMNPMYGMPNRNQVPPQVQASQVPNIYSAPGQMQYQQMARPGQQVVDPHRNPMVVNGQEYPYQNTQKFAQASISQYQMQQPYPFQQYQQGVDLSQGTQGVRVPNQVTVGQVPLQNSSQIVEDSSKIQSNLTVPPNNGNSGPPSSVVTAPKSQGPSSQGSANNEEHRKQVLKQQQQRLLLLRHASKCPHDNGSCPFTPNCFAMKMLWKHIMSCKNQDCKTPHCISSKYVLSHYSKCKQRTCPVCGPVYEAIVNNYENSQRALKRDSAQVSSNLPPSITTVAIKNDQSNSETQPPKKKPRKNQQQAQQASQNESRSDHALADDLAQPEQDQENHEASAESVKAAAPKKKRQPSKKQQQQSESASSGNQEVLSIHAAPALPSQPAPVLVINTTQLQKSVYPLDPVSSAIYIFSNEQIQSHIKSIHEGLKVKGSKIKEICKPIIDELFRMPHTQSIFGAPVDPVALGLEDYTEKIKCPMDLGTVMKRLDSLAYRNFHLFVADVHLTFDNAILYNPPKSDVHALAKLLKRDFDTKFKIRYANFEKAIVDSRSCPDNCSICGEMKLEFAPPVYYCSGPCAKPIRRSAWFYGNSTNTHFICTACFGGAKGSDTIQLADIAVAKSELEQNKRQHTEVHEENWVECEGECKRWVHQVCCLFNSRRNVQGLSFVCPSCFVEKREKEQNESKIVLPVTKPMRASDLPKTVLSEFLEKRIYKRLEIAYEETAAKLNIPVSSVEKCPQLTLRQVSCTDKLQIVRDGVFNRYKDKNYPSDFPCRTKCLVLFQNIDGQDVILFGMYVYEYGHKCPQPNQRRVYVSYLDSVYYLRPKQYRTLVYHEIIISYLDYVKARGFHTAHIWACPPQKGDDYILHIHPSDQKTPRPQILRVWYDDMLKRCLERGIVLEVTDLHTEYLADPNNDATVLPYFEGDYWINEAEDIIKNLSDTKRSSSAGEYATTSDKRKNKNKKAGAAIVEPLTKSERDPLMHKLANIIEPMKDTFFVARLHPKEYAEKFLDQKSGDNNSGEASAEADGDADADVKDSANLEKRFDEEEKNATAAIEMSEMNAAEVKKEDVELAAAAESAADQGQVSETVVDETAAAAAAAAADKASSEETNMNLSSEEPLSNDQKVGEENVDNSVIESKFDESADRDGGAGDVAPTPYVPRTILCGEDMPNLPDDTEDVDEVQMNEHFDTRQAFLNLCQGNHYQFDQLRRAKHSSMMVLYHLHNPDAPKFVPNCQLCHSDILTGQRWHCRTCDIDYCLNCYSSNQRIHPHQLQLTGGEASAPPAITEEQRRERQRSVQLHMQLLTHAANCQKCESRHCIKMKDFLMHESACSIKLAGGCRICTRVSQLLNIHSRSCRIVNCKVPHCLELREKIRKLALSQLQMDDRRRKQMNIEYSRTGPRPTEDDDS